MISSKPTRPPIPSNTTPNTAKKRTFDELQQSMNMSPINQSEQNQQQKTRKRRKTQHNNNNSNTNTSSPSPSNTAQNTSPSNTTITAQNTSSIAPINTAITNIMNTANNQYQCINCHNVFPMDSFLYKSGKIKEYMVQWS